MPAIWEKWKLRQLKQMQQACGKQILARACFILECIYCAAPTLECHQCQSVCFQGSLECLLRSLLNTPHSSTTTLSPSAQSLLDFFIPDVFLLFRLAVLFFASEHANSIFCILLWKLTYKMEDWQTWYLYIFDHSFWGKNTQKTCNSRHLLKICYDSA